MVYFLDMMENVSVALEVPLSVVYVQVKTLLLLSLHVLQACKIEEHVWGENDRLFKLGCEDSLVSYIH